MAVFELKRTGSKKDLLDDVYRLAIVSQKIDCIGYFVLAAPVEQLFKMIEKLRIFNQLSSETSSPAAIKFNVFDGTSTLYHSADHGEANEFYVNLMGGSKVVLATLPKRLAAMNPEEVEEDATEVEEEDQLGEQQIDEQPQDPQQVVEGALGQGYGFLIYGVSRDQTMLRKKVQHRMTLALTEQKLPSETDALNGDPVVAPGVMLELPPTHPRSDV